MAWLQQLFGQPDRDTGVANQALDTLAQQLLASLLGMAWFVEARDPYTGGHLWRVSQYARLLASQSKCSDADVALIGLGGFLHDLGKIGIPDAVLRKPDRLTEDEYAIIKTHPDLGLRMLGGHPLAALVRDAVHLHHERPDGQGYPLGLRGDAIPKMAQGVAICDAFDAMTSSRPYRQGMPRQRAMDNLAAAKGRQFDPELTELFVALGQAGTLDHIMGHSDEGIPLQVCDMCGPTLVLRENHQRGQRLFCRNCAGEYLLEVGDAGLVATATGNQGSAADLEPELDSALIARSIRAAVQSMPATEMLAAAALASVRVG